MPPKRSKQNVDTHLPPSKKLKESDHDDNNEIIKFDRLSDEVFYEICLFLDAKTFNNLPLINQKINEKFNACLENMLDYDELEAVMEKKNISIPFLIWTCQSKIFKKYRNANKLNLEVYFKALQRRPGGNHDEFIYRFTILFSGNKKPELKKGTINNWDGTITANKMGNWKNPRDIHNLLQTLSRLSFETPNNLKIFYNTVSDMRTSLEEYDTEWSSIEMNADFNGKSILKFHQQAIYPQDRTISGTLREKPSVSANPHASNMLEQLTSYCGLLRPINESEKTSPGSKEPAGKEMSNFKDNISIERCVSTVFSL